MRIGIDGACLSNRRGFGRFARQIVAALSRSGSPHEFSLFIDRPSLATTEIPRGFEPVPIDVKEAPSRAAAAAGRRSIGDMMAVSRAIARSGIDLIYFPASYSFVPVWGVKRVVVTLHDTLALAHPELVFHEGRGRLAWKAKEHAAVAWANRIVTVSHAAKRDLISWFRLRDDRVHVVSEAPDPAFSPRLGSEGEAILNRYGVDSTRRFWLYVGGLSPHKNLLRLIEAFAGLGDDERLVLVGDFGDVFHTHVPELRDAVSRLNLSGRVRFTGFVPDEELAYLYSRSFALIQPSLMEGFGLPPIEAMACGTPVISSTAGSLPEVIDDAGIFFDPTDVTAITRSMAMFRDDPSLRDLLSRRALTRSGQFTWEKASASLLECFDSLDTIPSRTASRKTA